MLLPTQIAQFLSIDKLFSSSVDIQQLVITHYCWSGTAQQECLGTCGGVS